MKARPAVRRPSRKWLEIGLFLAPAVALYSIFLIVPVIEAGRYSVYAWNGLGALTDFVGLGNYREAFGDPAFRQAMQHNGSLVGLSLVIQLPLSLGVALLLNRRLRARGNTAGKSRRSTSVVMQWSPRVGGRSTEKDVSSRNHNQSSDTGF